MATHLPPHLFCTVFLPSFILLKEELRALHTINMHKFVSRLGHRKVAVSSIAEPLMEVSELLVLLNNVVNVTDLKTSSLCNFLLHVFCHFYLARFLIIVHSRA